MERLVILAGQILESSKKNTSIQQYHELKKLLPSHIINMSKQLRARNTRHHNALMKKVSNICNNKYINDGLKRRVAKELKLQQQATKKQLQYATESASFHSFNKLKRLERHSKHICINVKCVNIN